MRRLITVAVRITRKTHALLATLWDACVAGVDRTLRLRGFVYQTVMNLSTGKRELHIAREGSTALLGIVRDGVLFQCA